MATTETIKASEIKPGDVILPPERELRLWMRRHCAENGMTESALNLTVREVKQGRPDKRGPWLVVVTDQTPEWNAGHERTFPFTFKARPDTLWPVISRLAQ